MHSQDIISITSGENSIFYPINIKNCEPNITLYQNSAVIANHFNLFTT